MLGLPYIHKAVSVIKRAALVRIKGFDRYYGNSKEICREIVNECWNGKYFMASAGHFSQFWTRDFGFCTKPLINLGYKTQVKQTLKYALDLFSKYNKVTTTISHYNLPYDFPYYAPDSLAYFIRSLRLSNSYDMIKQNSDFLNKEISRFYNIVLDADTGLVKKNRTYSSMKDLSVRISSCYDNCCVALLNNELKKIKLLDNPLKNYNFKKIIKDNFWIDNYFIDDLSGNYFITGDANVFPFYFEVFTEKNMLKSALAKIQEIGLDKPFPLKYYNSKEKKQKMIIWDKIIRNYERDTIWWHMGPLYIELVKKIDKNKANFYIRQYKQIIEKYGSYLELFNPDGTPYIKLFYIADESMLWASMLLEMINK